MKRIVAVVLISLLVVPPASAGQKARKPIEWHKAQTLKAGTEILVTVTGGQSGDVRLLFADEAFLVTLRTTSPKLPGRVEKVLLEVGAYWPAIVNDGLVYKSKRVRVSPNGIFDGDRKVADLANVVWHTPRAEVLAISEPPHSHIGRNILIGIGLYFLVPVVVFAVVCGTVGCGPT